MSPASGPGATRDATALHVVLHQPEIAAIVGSTELDAAAVLQMLADGVKRVASSLGTGEELSIEGFAVRVVGEFHAIIHPELPIFENSGYVLTADGQSVYHPGDSFELPGQQVDVFCAHGLRGTLGVVALSFMPFLIRGLGFLPFIVFGGVLNTWQLILRYKALRSAHGLSWGRALAATLLPYLAYLLVWLLLGGLLALVMGLAIGGVR